MDKSHSTPRESRPRRAAASRTPTRHIRELPNATGSATAHQDRSASRRRSRRRSGRPSEPESEPARGEDTSDVLELDEDDGDLATIDLTPGFKRLLLAELGDEGFLKELTRKTRLAETAGVYQAEVTSFLMWLAQHHPSLEAGAVDVAHITGYRDHLRGCGLSSSTQRVALASLRVFYDYKLGLPKGSLRNPARQLPLPPRGPLRVRAYTPQQAFAILTTARHAALTAKEVGDVRGWFLAARDHAMLTTVLLSGLRRGELRRLRLGDLGIDGERPWIKVRGKGNTPRTRRIPRALAGLLREYLEQVRGHGGDNDFLFCHLAETVPGRYTWVKAGLAADEDRLLARHIVHKLRGEETEGYGIGPCTLTAAASRWGTRAGIDGPHGSHRWRHSHASACAERGMSLRGICERLGHSPENLIGLAGWEIATVRYIHVRDEYLHHLVDRALPAPVPPSTAIPALPGFDPTHEDAGEEAGQVARGQAA